jgi:uncharacterized coiled-coil protein SlyX
VEVDVLVETVADASGKPLVRRRHECIDDALAEIRQLEARLIVQAQTIRALSGEIALLELASDRQHAGLAAADRSRCLDKSTSSDRQRCAEIDL